MERIDQSSSGIKRLAAELISVLKDKNLKIAFAESMTGGLLSASITRIPGASSVLLGSVVCYDAEIKKHLLKVDDHILQKFGAESPETTLAMAEGINSLFPNASVILALTGSASSPVNDYRISNPPGSVFFSYGFAGRALNNHTARITGGREEVLEQATMLAFTLLLTCLRNAHEKTVSK